MNSHAASARRTRSRLRHASQAIENSAIEESASAIRAHRPRSGRSKYKIDIAATPRNAAHAPKRRNRRISHGNANGIRIVQFTRKDRVLPWSWSQSVDADARTAAANEPPPGNGSAETL